VLVVDHDAVNKNVSTPAVSRAEKVVISQLRVIYESIGQRCQGSVAIRRLRCEKKISSNEKDEMRY